VIGAGTVNSTGEVLAEPYQEGNKGSQDTACLQQTEYRYSYRL